ncbi:amidase [Vulcanisaeta thermophila]|uniref:amidase n=1 Tax=Vulcanisaeta thermophila TaxID=867917 RepID=UPI0009FBC8B4|nr:amidase [Vulcanisaeta thermophila]
MMKFDDMFDLLIEPNLRPEPKLILTIDEVVRRVSSPYDVVMKSLMKIRENIKLNAFITVLEEEALRIAEDIESKLRIGKIVGLLAAVPVAVKDNIFTRNIKTTMASKIFSDYVPKYNADIVNKLLSEDAIIIGKTNLHEFASGVSNISSYFGPVRNPYNPEHISGGSSGGSAVAVATNSVPIAIGTDTSGSIRIPAAFCGVIGYKPSYDLISREGVFPLAWSLDTIGLLGNNILDIAYVFYTVISNESIKYRFDLLRIKDGVNPKRVTIGYIHVDEDNPVHKVFMDTLSKLNSEGFNIEKISIDIDTINNTQRIIRLAEAAAVHNELFKLRGNDYSPDVAELIRQGLKISATDYINALRRKIYIASTIAQLFKRVDIIATPTVPIVAPKIVEVMGHEIEFRSIITRYTLLANLIGIPAISLPIGKINSLPVGIQLMSDLYNDEKLLTTANTIQQIIKY